MSKTLKNILIGTTLAEGSDEVVQAAFGLARNSDAVAHLVHVIPPALAGTTEADGQEWFARLTEQAWRAGLDGIHFRLRIEHGLPYRVLEALAGELEADLIVVGAADPGRRRPPGLGSTAERVLRRATCPVLVVRPGLPFPPQRILVPVDFTTAATGAFRYGVNLLRELEGRLPGTEILFVLSPGESSIHFSAQQLARFAVDELHRFVDRNLPDEALQVERKVRAGNTVEQILAEIEERQPDLVVLGPQGRSGLEHLLIGSVADKVLRDAPTSILVVPPETARREAETALEAKRNADWSFVSDEEPVVAGCG